jgi:hypothetical protein
MKSEGDGHGKFRFHLVVSSELTVVVRCVIFCMAKYHKYC